MQFQLWPNLGISTKFKKPKPIQDQTNTLMHRTSIASFSLLKKLRLFSVDLFQNNFFLIETAISTLTKFPFYTKKLKKLKLETFTVSDSGKEVRRDQKSRRVNYPSTRTLACFQIRVKRPRASWNQINKFTQSVRETSFSLLKY